METTIKTQQANNSVSSTKSVSGKESAFWEKLEFSRFGIISMLVVVLGCVGGMAASFGAKDDVVKLGMMAFPTIISLALILAVAKMRIIVYVSIIAIILDLIVLIF